MFPLRDMHVLAHTPKMTVQLDWIPSIDDFAARLVLIRHKMGWNLKEAALACGIRAQSWREWELEHRKPRDYENVCRQISEHSGCNLVWLMTGYTPPTPGGGIARGPIPLVEPPPGFEPGTFSLQANRNRGNAAPTHRPVTPLRRAS